MITLLNKHLVFNTFGVDTFDSLEIAIHSMAPSMVEYYLSDLSEYNDEFYLNKRNVEKTIMVGEYSLYYDYDENISLEVDMINGSEEETGSLW